MKRNTDFTSDAVKESVQATMTKVENYFNNHWAPEKYPDFNAEEVKVAKLTDKFKYPNHWEW